MFCLDGTTGQHIWTFTPPAIPKANASAGIKPNPFGCYNAGIYGTAEVRGGRVYFGAQDCAAWAVNASTGTLLWTRPTVGVVSVSSPAVGHAAAGQEAVFFGTNTFNTYLPWSPDSPLSAAVYAVSGDTGNVIWRHNVTGDGVDSSPALTPTSVLVGSSTSGSGTIDRRQPQPHPPAALLALDRATGEVLWNFSSPSLAAAGLGNAILYDADAGKDGAALGSGGLARFGGCDCMLYSIPADGTGPSAVVLPQRSSALGKCGGCV
eukprot:SAG22_NODE_474_length_10034_cov_21.356517_4_plen_264_part_00